MGWGGRWEGNIGRRGKCVPRADSYRHMAKPSQCHKAIILQLSKLIFFNVLVFKVKVKSLSHVQLLRTHGLQPTRLLCPRDFPGKSTGVGCHFLLQKIFLTQGLNPGLLHCRQTLYHLSHQGSLISV